MDAFLDKVRLAFSSGPAETLPKPLPGRESWQDEGRTRACVNCDRVFGPELSRHHCRVCDRTICGHCSSHYIPQSPAPAGTAWLRVCDFCYHLREPLLSETATLLEQQAAYQQSHWLRGTVAPCAPGGILPHTASVRRAGKPAPKQAPGDLTWDVPPMLEPDFGLSQADRDQLAVLQASQPPAAAQSDGLSSTPPSPRTSGPTPPPVVEPALSMQATLQSVFSAAAEQHLQQLAAQLLFSEAVAQRDVWVPLVSRLASRAVVAIDPHLHLLAPVRSGQGYAIRDEVLRPLEPGSRIKYPDPCDRIKVKKLLDAGSPSDSSVVAGVVCKRNLARKNMASVIDRPCRVALVSGGIDSSKGLPDTAGGSTLHTLENVSYEHNVLQLAHQVVTRLLELEVELVLVEGLVAGKVMEYMASHRISLVHNISRTMLERLAPCMGCDVTDRWQLLTSRNVGLCRYFKVDPLGLMPPGAAGSEQPGPQHGRTASSGSGLGGTSSSGQVTSFSGQGVAATLTHLVGARPLAATILLRGAGEEQAVRIKRVVKFLVQVAYHARLECSFLAAQLTAALVSLGEEVPLSVALGGLEAYRTLVQSAVAASVAHSASCMPNGLMLSISPHISMWDASLASEYDEVLRSLDPPPPPAPMPTTILAVRESGSPSMPHAPNRRSTEVAVAAATLSSSLYSSAIHQRSGGGAVGASPAPRSPSPSPGTSPRTSALLQPQMPGLPRHGRSASGYVESSPPQAGLSRPPLVPVVSPPPLPGSGRSSLTGSCTGPAQRPSIPGASNPMSRQTSHTLPPTSVFAMSPTQSMQLPNGSGPGAGGLQTAGSGGSARGLHSVRSGPMTISDLDDPAHEDMGGLSASAIAALAVAAGRGMMPSSFLPSPSAPVPLELQAAADAIQDQQAERSRLGAENTSSERFDDPLRSSLEAPVTPTARTTSQAGGDPRFSPIVQQQLPQPSQQQLQGVVTSVNGPQPMAVQLQQPGVQGGPSGPATPRAAAAMASGGGATPTAGRASQDDGLGSSMSAHDSFKAAHGWKVKELMSFSMSTSARRKARRAVCEPFGATLIHLYGDGDLSLREWLLRNYPRPNSVCPSPGCMEPMESHSRTFVHGGSRITLSWVTLEPQAALPGAKENQVWMWMRPKGKGHLASRDIKRVALPEAAACISWAALLQLFMKGDQLELSGRCLHYDFVRYLGIGRMVLCVFQDRLRLYTPVLPEMCCTYSHKAQLQWLRDEASDLLMQGDDAFATIERLLLSSQQGAAPGPDAAGSAPLAPTEPALQQLALEEAALGAPPNSSGPSFAQSTGSMLSMSANAAAAPLSASGLLSSAFQLQDAQQAALDAQLRTHWLPMLYADRASLKAQVTQILQQAWYMAAPLQQSGPLTAAPSVLSTVPSSLRPVAVPPPGSTLCLQSVPESNPPSGVATAEGTSPMVGAVSFNPAINSVASFLELQDSISRRRTELSFASPWAAGAAGVAGVAPLESAGRKDSGEGSFSLQPPMTEAGGSTGTLPPRPPQLPQVTEQAEVQPEADMDPTASGRTLDSSKSVKQTASNAPDTPPRAPGAATTAGGLMDLVEAQRQIARTKRTLAYTLLTWVSRLQDNTAFTAACASMSAAMTSHNSTEPSQGGSAPAFQQQQQQPTVYQASISPRGNSLDQERPSLSVGTGAPPDAAPPTLFGMQSGNFSSGRVMPAIPSTEDGASGITAIDRGAMAVPIVRGAGGPVALAAVADLVVRASSNRANSNGSVGMDGTQRLGQSMSLLEGSASMLAMVAAPPMATGSAMHSRRPSNHGGGDPLQMSPSRGTGLSHIGSHGTAPRPSGTVTPLRPVSPAASELGGDDDDQEEEEEEEDDEEDEETVHSYSWLGQQHGTAGEDYEDDDSALYPQALPSLYRSDEASITSSHPAAHDSMTSLGPPQGRSFSSAFRQQPTGTLSAAIAAHQAVVSGGGGTDPPLIKRLSYQQLQSEPIPSEGAAGLPPLPHGQMHVRFAATGNTPPSEAGSLAASGTLHNIPLPGMGRGEEGASGAGGSVNIKRAPTLRAIQGVARKLGNLVTNSNSAVIGRLYLACRTILPDAPCDVLCPIYDLEYTSIIAYSLSSKFYQQHLNVAFKALLQATRGVAPPHLSSAASWTAAGGGLGPSISHLTLNLGHANSILNASTIGGPSTLGMQMNMARAAALFNSGPLGSGSVPAPAAPTLGSCTSGPRGVVPNGMSLTPADWAALLCSGEPYHITHTFEDTAQPTPWTRAKFQVVVYFAPQFAELRRQLVQGGEGAFVTSITRCMAWEQRGGKSNAYFAKTKDDRYIIKSLSKTEKSSFLTIAPDYFRHMSRRHLAGARTCLAKILGVFTITIKPTTAGGPSGPGKDTVMDLIIQENCFYDRPITRIYDLKGSERNRFNPKAPVNSNEWSGEVALDDNLREDIQDTPYFVAPSAHADLLAALWEDTAFLSRLGIMDYSLLVGVDNQNRLLAMAVIDYIRQYTLDKKMETWVKGSGILGGNGKEPTIISPRDYRIRFRRAILSYFTRVPASAALRDLPVPDDMQDY